MGRGRSRAEQDLGDLSSQITAAELCDRLHRAVDLNVSLLEHKTGAQVARGGAHGEPRLLALLREQRVCSVRDRLTARGLILDVEHQRLGAVVAACAASLAR